MFVEKVQPNIQLIHLNAKKKKTKKWICLVTLFCIFSINLVCARFNVTCRLLWWCFYVFRADIFLVFCHAFTESASSFSSIFRVRSSFCSSIVLKGLKTLCVNKHVKLKSCLCLTWLSNTWPLTFVSYRCVRWETDWTDGGGSPEVLLFLFQSVWEKRH